MAKFPPQPTYPLAIDSDRTLFLVYNTSEAKTLLDNSAWSEEIEIIPVKSNENEIWAENGFANISGELFYYDSVEKNPDGKIYKFKNCARNIGGKKTKFNPAGTWVRGFVIAEHHNQLVDATISIENYLLDLEDEVIKLEEQPFCLDDIKCPEVVLETSFQEQENNCEGITINYTITINGAYNNFRLDFGDGEFTTSPSSGIHTYAPNSNIDPIITIGNEQCTIVQTPIERNNSQIPEETIEETNFEIVLPSPIAFPDIEIPDCPTVPLDFDLPQLIIPQINLTNTIPDIAINIPSIPSQINIVPPIQIPEQITFGPAPFFPVEIDFGEVNIPDTIDFSNTPEIPALINFGPVNIPSQINFGDVSFPEVNINGNINFGDAPVVDYNAEIVFGEAPERDYNGSVEFGDAPVIEFGPAPSFPTTITFGNVPNIPTTITFGDVPNIPTTINFGDVPDIPDINFGDVPDIPDIEFGDPPTIPDIEITPYTIPDVTITPYTIPDVYITPYTIPDVKFGPAPYIPNFIYFGTLPYIPNIINFGNVPNIPNIINFGEAPDIPNIINFGEVPYIPNKIEFGNAPDIPEQINFGDLPPFPDIGFETPPTFPDIGFESPPSFPDIGFVTPPDIPDIGINWGNPPTITVEISCPSSGSPTSFARRDYFENEDFEDDFSDIKLEINNEDIGIPSEIKIVAPKEFPQIEITHNLPDSIPIISNLPERIELFQESPILHEINIVGSYSIPKTIEIVSQNIPKSILLDSSNLPSSIPLEVPEISPIKLDASEIPDSIKVVGIPDSIELKIPDEIIAKLEIPDNLEVPLVYKGGPIPIQFDNTNLGNGDGPCFTLVPCDPKK